MSADQAIDKITDIFKTFPKFSELSFGDRKDYEELISRYPPIDGISFVSLMNWWNSLESCRIAQLNGNIIISHWLPGLEDLSGLSIAGVKYIDETICEIFDYQISNNQSARVVHIPEFVISNIKHPELFKFTAMPELDEYVLPVAAVYPLSNQPVFKRQRIRRFLGNCEGKEITIKELDLSDVCNKDLLLEVVTKWSRHNRGNMFSSFSDDNMRRYIQNSELLGIRNLCLFIDGEIHGCLLYSAPSDKRYVIAESLRLSGDVPYMFEYLTYAFCDRLADRGVSYVNLTFDLGVVSLRELKLTLGSTNTFRKYAIEPKSTIVH